MPEIDRTQDHWDITHHYVEAHEPESVVPSSEISFATRRTLRTESNRRAIAAARTAGDRALLNQSVYLFNDLVETGLELSAGDPYRITLISQVCTRFLDRAEQRAVAATSGQLMKPRHQQNG
ncbi:hypothetical protein [Streptomyces adonidis]|uniref:hypothetical protein n=1 Tax=Streptomyces adonidis TaxID=3231367 RepID=UPI0034DAD8B3